MSEETADSAVAAKETDRPYEVWIYCGLFLVPWAQKGGVPGPMPKERAERYVELLFERAGVSGEARPMLD